VAVAVSVLQRVCGSSPLHQCQVSSVCCSKCVLQYVDVAAELQSEVKDSVSRKFLSCFKKLADTL